ncbi:hypothetical protein AVEN_133756-1 [Araneus ventricosus]|uniref:Uncharacterized protein n=1 Tax=Araneus ventricosus TaxID=182803 RepID=A0A4Y2B9W8_ARAVE|nr:hypothetical protein AVEN_133756-1 [Araneus ventricosus]
MKGILTIQSETSLYHPTDCSTKKPARRLTIQLPFLSNFRQRCLLAASLGNEGIKLQSSNPRNRNGIFRCNWYVAHSRARELWLQLKTAQEKEDQQKPNPDAKVGGGLLSYNGVTKGWGRIHGLSPPFRGELPFYFGL